MRSACCRSRRAGPSALTVEESGEEDEELSVGSDDDDSVELADQGALAYLKSDALPDPKGKQSYELFEPGKNKAGYRTNKKQLRAVLPLFDCTQTASWSSFSTTHKTHHVMKEDGLDAGALNLCPSEAVILCRIRGERVAQRE